MDRGDQYDKGEQAEDYRPLHTLVESFSNIAVTTDRDVGNYSDQIYRKVRQFSCCNLPRNTVGHYHGIERRISILLLGEVGTGKSSLGNLILRRNRHATANGLNPCTKDYPETPFEVDGFSFNIMDTPGISDDNNVQNIAENIMSRLETIDVIMLVFRMDIRFTSRQQESISKIEEQFGPKIFNHCIVVFTHADQARGNLPSLSEFIVHSGKFLPILAMKVSNRTIAVHNFDHDMQFQQAQRTHMLCAVLSLVESNNRVPYSKSLFDSAAWSCRKVQQAKRNLSIMQMVISSFILLSSRNELKRLVEKKDVSDTCIDEIINLLNICSLEGVSRSDVISFAKRFVKTNIDAFENQLTQKTTIREHTEESFKRAEKHEQEDEMKEVFKNYLREHLKSINQADFDKIKSTGKISSETMSQLKIMFKSTHLLQFFEDSDIDRAIRDMVSRDFRNVVRVAEEERPSVKKAQLYELNQPLTAELLDLIKNSDLNDLKNFLSGKYPKASNLKCKSDHCKGLITEYDINKEIEKYFHKEKQNIETTYNSKLLKQKEELRKEIVCVIVDKLNEFLLGKSKTDLVKLKVDLVRNKIPPEIAKIVHENLPKEYNLYFSKMEIDKQLLSVLKTFIDTVQTITRKGCFPAQSLVISKVSGLISIASVQIGTKVLTLTADNILKYQDVFLVAHACSSSTNTYIKITTERNNVINISPNHCIQVGGPKRLKKASDVKVNDIIFTTDADGVTADRVTSVDMTILKGAFCPYTLNGMIIVDGVAASCFTTTVSPEMSQRLLGPLRFLYTFMPLPLYKLIFSPKNVSLLLDILQDVKEFLKKWEHLLLKKE